MNTNVNNQNYSVLNSGKESGTTLVVKSSVSEEAGSIQRDQTSDKPRQSFLSTLMRVLSSVSF